MNSKRSTLIILILFLAMIPEARALTPQSQTVKIIETHDDRWILETGIGIDSSLVTVKDPSMDLRAYLVFRGIKINYWEPLKNATLRLHTASSLPSDPNSSITFYGIKLSDLQLEGYLSPSTVLSLGFTSASTAYNTSEFSGSKWHEIDVTSIVEELIRNPNWDGDGIDGSETGDAIGFHILGAEGDDKRYFYDKSAGNGLEAQLVIHWNHEPPPPATGWEFIEIHGENYSIWKYSDLGDIELRYHSTNTLRYHNSTTGVDGSVNWAGSGFSQYGGQMEKIGFLGNWTLILADNASTSVYYSDDEFATGSIYVSECNDQYDKFKPYQGNQGSLVIDQNDTQTFHVVWSTVTPWQTGTYNLVYSNFTILANKSLSWAPSYTNITNVGTEQFSPDLYSEKDGTLHLAWYGHQGTAEDQIWYRKRYQNGTWTSQVRVTEGDVSWSHRPDVVVNETSGDALIVWMRETNNLYYDFVFANNTDGPDRSLCAGQYHSMVNDRDANRAYLAYGYFYSSQYFDVDLRYMDINNASSWSSTINVSPHNEKHKQPVISVNEVNDTLAVVWDNEWNEYTSFNYWQIGLSPVEGKTKLSNYWSRYPNMPDYHERHTNWITYAVFAPNGTNIYNSTTLTGAEDWIETYDPDPEDPNPGGTWASSGPFTRFKTRLYILILGIVMIFGPLMYFAYQRPSGYVFIVGLLIMVIGFAFMIASGSI